MSSLRYLERLRTVGYGSSLDGQLLLWNLEHHSCHGRDFSSHSCTSQHNMSPVLEKVVNIPTSGAVRHIQSSLKSFRHRPILQHMMKRAMGTVSSDTSLPPDRPEECEAPSGGKSKQVKMDFEQAETNNVSGYLKESVCEGSVCIEELSQFGSADVSYRFIHMLKAAESSSSHSCTPPPSNSNVIEQASGSGAVGVSGHLDTGTQPGSYRYHPLKNTLVAYPVAHLKKYVSPVSVFESFRYYHSTSHTSASHQVQNRHHILYDNEEQKQASEEQETVKKRSMRRKRQEAEESPILVSSPQSPGFASSSDTLHGGSVSSSPAQEETVGLSGSSEYHTASPKAESLEALQHKLCKMPRQWEYTPFGLRHQSSRAEHRSSKRGSHGVEFSIMTYNILAQDLLENHPYLYNGCKSRSLDWSDRQQRLLAEIIHHTPDVINMQEVQHNHFHGDLLPKLKEMGYRGVYQKRANSSDGCATLWKQDKFQLLRSTPVNYQRGEILNRDNIAIIIELLPVRAAADANSNVKKQEEDKLVIANTHLLFNPRRGDVKLAQLMVLMAEIDKCAFIGPAESEYAQLHPNPWNSGKSKGKYSPVIMTGDFNLQPHSELYNFIIRGHLDYDGLLVRTMSGQEEGRFGADRLLDRHFFSPTFGITERCQYHMVINSRLQSARIPKLMPSSTHEPRPVDFTQETSEEEWECSTVAPLRVNTGSLWHHLNLISAYRHRIERLERRREEVTTHHSRAACTVDYIFYTVDSKELRTHRDEIRLKNIRDGRLKLISRYGLMSAEELAQMGGIPNHTLASDHLCLIAKFLLK